MEGLQTETSSKARLLSSKVMDFEKSLNELTVQLNLFTSRQKQSLKDRRRQWQEYLAHIHSVEQRVAVMAQIKKVEERILEMGHKRQVFEKYLGKLSEQFDIYSKVCLTDNLVSTNAMATFVMPKYGELVQNGLEESSLLHPQPRVQDVPQSEVSQDGV